MSRLSARDIALLSVYMDLGAGRRGVDMGPSALRVAGLSNRIAELGFTIRERGSIHAQEPELVSAGPQGAHHAKEIARVCGEARREIMAILDSGALPLALGGDHSMAIGTVSGAAEWFARRGKKIGLIWLDAHADMNIPATTPSGNIHGMALSVLLGHTVPGFEGWSGSTGALSPEHTCLLGARLIDPKEREIVRASGIRVFTMTEIDERGMAACMAEAIERVRTGTAGLYFSLDLDAIDPSVAPGVGSPVEGGLTYREAYYACEKVAASKALLGMDVVELNPILDQGNRTAELAVGLVASALGEVIL